MSLSPRVRALLEAEWPVIAEQIDAQVREALDVALGLPHMSLEEAAQRRGEAVDGILEALAEFDERERADGALDLFEALRADLPDADECLALIASEELSVSEGLRSAIARLRLAEDLSAAVSAPAGRREGQVKRVLAVERARIEQRRAGRLPAAVAAAGRFRLSETLEHEPDGRAANLRLDEAVDVPAGWQE